MGAHGIAYSLVDDKIVDADGAVVGYLAQFKGPTKETGTLADKFVSPALNDCSG